VRRKRKTRYTWLPIRNGRTFGEESADAAYQDFILDIPINGDVVVGVTPVVADTPQGTITTTETEGIGEIIGNEYVLKRIVGKCFVSWTNTNATSGAVGIDVLEDAAVLVTAGFFVARAEVGNPDQPIALGESQILYNPQSAFLTRQPWIWRRSWILGTGGFGPGLSEDIGTTFPQGGVFRGRGSWPINNAGYGSVQDGPHIDAKTGRRIRLEERLWFAFSGSLLNGIGTEASMVPQIEVTLDARYLGALRRPRGRSNFA